ncbi:hypothetical protein [Bacillus cereus]|uniref:Uncharacterized protein n=1 Tax=Bacillus cereus HuA3-9 TaxID=1053205 RepID=R8CIT0_BACCE|nr:hypothetical protein IGA_05678 [Bacillus cereus HuA3-9]
MSVNLNIQDVSVDMRDNGVFWNPGEIAEMIVTTKSAHSLSIIAWINLKQKTIRMMEIKEKNGICPLCNKLAESCGELNESQNRMDILEEVYNWLKKCEKYRIHLAFYGYDKFTVVA